MTALLVALAVVAVAVVVVAVVVVAAAFTSRLGARTLIAGS